MLQTKKRGLGLAVAGLLILAYPDPPTSTAPVPDLPPPPGVEELERIEELAGWVFGDTRGYRLLDRHVSISAAIREQRHTFELFRALPDDELRRRRVSELPYGAILQEVSARHGVDSLLLAAVVEAESGFDPTAVSERGAVGLMQVLPSTAAQFGEFDLRDPRANVEAGALYLGYLLARYDENLELAVAAYNAGPGTVDRFGGVPPFRETRGYVQKVLDSYVEHHRRLWQEEGELTALLATVDV